MLKLFYTKKWFRWYLYVITVIQTIVEILVIIFVWAMCTPVQALWTPELIESGAAQCWNPAIEQDTAFLGQGESPNFRYQGYVVLQLLQSFQKVMVNAKSMT